MRTRNDGIRLLRSLLNDRADEYAREGVFASNPEMREVFAAAREVLDAPDPARLIALIVAADRGVEPPDTATRQTYGAPCAVALCDIALRASEAMRSARRAYEDKALRAAGLRPIIREKGERWYQLTGRWKARGDDVLSRAQALALIGIHGDNGPMPHLAAVLCPEETGR